MASSKEARAPAAPAPRFSLAIVGRPNVGKSTLFNRLVGRRLALVDDQPGVTRDLREGDGRLADLRFTVIDTAGVEDATDDSLPARMRRLTERAVDEADICLFVIDGRAGVTPTDETFADILRRRAGAVILAVNKAEGRAGMAGVAEGYALGLGDPVPISAEHGEGMEDLLDALRPFADALTARYEAEAEEAARAAAADAARDEIDEDAERAADEAAFAAGAETVSDADGPAKPLRVAIVGRPNAGKSTLVNRILGEDRLLTGPEAGITRDSIGLETDWDGRVFKLFDTAGIRKRARVQEKLEKLSVGDALRAVRFAEVVVILMDAAGPFETQDLKLADLAEREGRAVVLAVNKWDLEPAKQARLVELSREAERLLPQLAGAPFVALSASTGRGVDRLRAAILDAHRAWTTRASTSALNRWLAAEVERHPPPAAAGRPVRIRYITQAKARPPTFVVFASKTDAVPDAYQRFLANGLRARLSLGGAPVRLLLRKSDNPYAPKGGGKTGRR